MATSSQARRRRNAILAAVLLALIFIVIVVLIIVGVSGKGNKGNKPTEPPVTTTPAAVLPTIPTITEEPTADPNATEDPLNSSLPTLDPTVTGDVTVTPTPTAPQEAGTVMYVTGDGVNVRKAATTESDKIASLSKGTAVTAYNKVGDFYSVKLSDGQLGYISAKFVSVDDPKKAEVTPSAKPTSTPDTSKGVTKYVNADKVNVRASGSSSATKLTSLVKGKEITAYSTVGDWTYIRYGNNKYGYISTKYLSDTAPSNATATATAAPTAAVTPTAKPTAAPTPTPTEKPKTWSDYGIPSAVASHLSGYNSYLEKITGSAGMNTFGESDPEKKQYSFYGFTTTDKKTFYVVYQGPSDAPVSVDITETRPTNN